MIIAVKVIDLDRAISFYTQKLGLSCRRQEKEWASIVVGGAEIHLYLNGGVSSGIEFYVDDIDVEVDKLKGLGVEFFSDERMPDFIKADQNQITEFPWGRTAFFKDSEGNQLAIVKDHKQKIAP